VFDICGAVNLAARFFGCYLRLWPKAEINEAEIKINLSSALRRKAEIDVAVKTFVFCFVLKNTDFIYMFSLHLFRQLSLSFGTIKLNSYAASALPHPPDLLNDTSFGTGSGANQCIGKGFDNHSSQKRSDSLSRRKGPLEITASVSFVGVPASLLVSNN
jgi:hypothetical protein